MLVDGFGPDSLERLCLLSNEVLSVLFFDLFACQQRRGS